MPDTRERAVAYLQHYFDLTYRKATGKSLENDSLREIEEAVDLIIEAAVVKIERGRSL